MFSVDWRRETLGAEKPVRRLLQDPRGGVQRHGAGFRSREEGERVQRRRSRTEIGPSGKRQRALGSLEPKCSLCHPQEEMRSCQFLVSVSVERQGVVGRLLSGILGPCQDWEDKEEGVTLCATCHHSHLRKSEATALCGSYS